MSRVAILLLLLMAQVAAAQDSAAPRPRRWDLRVDAGLVNTEGNTSVTTVNANQEFTWTDRRWRVEQAIRYLYSHADGQTTAESEGAVVRGDRVLDHWVRGYVALTYERNPFADVGRRFEQGAGFLYSVITTPRDTLTGETGLSIAQQRTADGSERFTFASARLAATWVHVFSTTATFRQVGILLPAFNDDGLRFTSETSLTVPVTKVLAIRAAYRVQQLNVNRLTGTDARVDRYLTTNLQVRF